MMIVFLGLPDHFGLALVTAIFDDVVEIAAVYSCGPEDVQVWLG